MACPLQGLGKSCLYCGDGVNDLAALAAADVGMAVGSAEASAAATLTDRHYSVAGQASNPFAEILCHLAFWTSQVWHHQTPSLTLLFACNWSTAHSFPVLLEEVFHSYYTLLSQPAHTGLPAKEDCISLALEETCATSSLPSQRYLWARQCCWLCCVTHSLV